MIRLEAAPALQQLRARARELYSDDLPDSDDLPAGYLRFLYGLPDEAPVISRVDQLPHHQRARPSWKRRKSEQGEDPIP